MKYIVIFHGAGKRSPNYVDDLIANIYANADDTTAFKIIPLYYGDIFQEYETLLQSQIEASPLYRNEHFKDVRPFINQFIIDIFQWHDEGIRRAIVQRILQQLQQGTGLDSRFNGAEFVFVAHSWGSVIATSADLFRRKGGSSIKSLTTFGCATHLWEYPDQLPFIPWTNFFHSMDVVGSTISQVFDSCIDIEVKDCGPSTELVGLEGLALLSEAHNDYWKSKTIAKHICSQIERS